MGTQGLQREHLARLAGGALSSHSRTNTADEFDGVLTSLQGQARRSRSLSTGDAGDVPATDEDGAAANGTPGSAGVMVPLTWLHDRCGTTVSRKDASSRQATLDLERDVVRRAYVVVAGTRCAADHLYARRHGVER